MVFSTLNIRNVAIAGHGQTGKSSLFENLLFVSGKEKEFIEPCTEKSTTGYTPEEVSRKISIYNSLANFVYKDRLVNIWDTPGSSDFVGEVITAFRSSGVSVLVVDGRFGVQIETIKLWRNLNSRNKPRMIFVNKMDDERADYNKVLKDLKDKFEVEFFPVTIPVSQGKSYKGVVDVFNGKAYGVTGTGKKEEEMEVPGDMAEEITRVKNLLAETAAEGDDDLFVKFLDEGELTKDEIIKGLTECMENNKAVPVFCGSCAKSSGILSLMDFIVDFSPSPLSHYDLTVSESGEESTVKFDENAPFSGLVIKTVFDQFSGKTSYVKIITGKIKADTEVYNIQENKKERIGKIYRCTGSRMEEIQEACAGDIVLCVKLASAKTNDTLAANQGSMVYKKLKHPYPVYSLAVKAKDKKQEDKLGELLLKKTEEDMTLRFSYNSETKQNVISGMGDLQLGIVLDKIKASLKIEIETSVPDIAYRETIQRKAQAEYTHKKQSGGHGQYGKVVLSIQPLERGMEYSFTNAVFGGAISKGYIPGVEKGVKEAMEHGVLAAYPVVDVGVTVLDGKEHPVDSSEMAFKIAARNAFREAMKKAGPILLEPVMNLTVFVESKYLGDIMSDLSGKRGKILGQDTLGSGIDEIRAQVPQSELMKYAVDLRSITSGTGSFEVSFDHYDPISGKIAEKIIEKAAANIALENEDE
ncbi:MAG: elongation factor G [Spirochaetes bacterium]|uniref:Elongation factor G n=1 Tax=Candidatus Gallitreponema excrementavium TaxID=2840840 RepID=A0A9D9N2K3_9SPIR|nr:elongation factor G [Candidatus Gallitreponema excrementavium]